MVLDSRSLGKKLRAYRSICGWSQEACAEKIGITPRYLADLERGDKSPTLETFICILNTLGASADDVLQDSLVIGYESKSKELLKRLERLDLSHRKQALDILESIISSFEKS